MWVHGCCRRWVRYFELGFRVALLLSLQRRIDDGGSCGQILGEVFGCEGGVLGVQFARVGGLRHAELRVAGMVGFGVFC